MDDIATDLEHCQIVLMNNHIIEEEEEDEQFRQVFNGECDITETCLDTVINIKNNHPSTTDLFVNSINDHFTSLGWRLLGRYIANNIHLDEVKLINFSITDGVIVSLFSELVRSSSLKEMSLQSNQFGIEGVRSMVGFLENSPLNTLLIHGNSNINTECFELLINALNGKSIEYLTFWECNITDISALDTYTLPNLIKLNLSGNNIGREGCITLCNILQTDGSTLEILLLHNTGMGDDEAELLATALTHNNKLDKLYFAYNSGITERGHVAFLKLLNDVSSIENTYHSNHTLSVCHLTAGNKISSLIYSVGFACQENRDNPTSEESARSKIINCHLNSQALEALCQLQGIEYTPGNLFADIDPILLPDILALIGNEHGQSELYTALIHTAPDLLSYIDRKALIKDAMKKNVARATELINQAEDTIYSILFVKLSQTHSLQPPLHSSMIIRYVE